MSSPLASCGHHEPHCGRTQHALVSGRPAQKTNWPSAGYHQLFSCWPVHFAHTRRSSAAHRAARARASGPRDASCATTIAALRSISSCGSSRRVRHSCGRPESPRAGRCNSRAVMSARRSHLWADNSATMAAIQLAAAFCATRAAARSHCAVGHCCVRPTVRNYGRRDDISGHISMHSKCGPTRRRAKHSADSSCIVD